MSTILMTGTIIVTLALIFYTIGILTEQRKEVINKKVLTFLTLGLIADITATACMIIGSSNSAFTFHGLIGYTALLAMIIETIFAYKFYLKNSTNSKVTKSLHIYSRFAYILWVVVYITGSLMASI